MPEVTPVDENSKPTTLKVGDLEITRVETGVATLSNPDFALVSAILALAKAIDGLRMRAQ